MVFNYSYTPPVGITPSNASIELYRFHLANDPGIWAQLLFVVWNALLRELTAGFDRELARGETAGVSPLYSAIVLGVDPVTGSFRPPAVRNVFNASHAPNQWNDWYEGFSPKSEIFYNGHIYHCMDNRNNSAIWVILNEATYTADNYTFPVFESFKNNITTLVSSIDYLDTRLDNDEFQLGNVSAILNSHLSDYQQHLSDYAQHLSDYEQHLLTENTFHSNISLLVDDINSRVGMLDEIQENLDEHTTRLTSLEGLYGSLNIRGSPGFAVTRNGLSMTTTGIIGNWTTPSDVYYNLIGGLFNTTSGVFTVNRTGYYQVKASLSYSTTASITAAIGSGVVPVVELARNVTTPESLIVGAFPILDVNIALLLTLRAILGSGEVVLTGDIHLNAGDQVFIRYVPDGLTIPINLGGSMGRGLFWSVSYLA